MHDRSMLLDLQRSSTVRIRASFFYLDHSMTVRTRFAPSPTGYLHIGGVRTALFSWLHAKHNGGEFILRIEDTDRERSTQESVDIILEGMEWLGLQIDEGPYYQTHRFDRYREVIQQLLNEGKAYHCYCSKERLDTLREDLMARKEKPRYDGRCRHLKTAPEGIKPVVRFLNPPDGSVVINDLVRGPVQISNAELDDLIIARSDGTPTYNLTVVVDDADMNVTHVIRGDDHLNNTPRQINMMRALGHEVPAFAHLPMILGEDGKRLSKRHGAVNVLQYRDAGYLPQAVLNYLVRLGWSHGDQEIFSMQELVEKFDIKDVNKSASTFNPEKLLWLNQQYLKVADAESLVAPLQRQFAQAGVTVGEQPALKDLIEVQKERVKTLAEMVEQSVFFYQEFDSYDEKASNKNFKPEAVAPLQALRAALEKLKSWEAEPVHEVIKQVAEQLDIKMGKVAQPLRIAVTGGAVSPSIDLTLILIGKQRSLARIDRAVEYINSQVCA